MRILFTAFILALCAVRPGPACAGDTLRLAVGQRGLWDTSVAELGQRGGIFGRHGLTLDILYSQGAAETLGAVISGSVDIGVSQHMEPPARPTTTITLIARRVTGH